MFRSEGYVNAYVVRELFDFFSHDEETRIQITNELKRRLLLKRHLMQAPMVTQQHFEVTSSEAGRIVADREISLGSKTKFCSGAFFRFFLSRKLFLSGPGGVVVPVDSAIMRNYYCPIGDETTTSLTVHVDKLGVGHLPREAEIPWSFIQSEYMSVRSREKLIALAEARAELARPRDRPLSIHKRRRLEELAALEPVAQGLLPYEGMVLAIPESENPDKATIREFLGLCPVKPRRPGRPPKKQAAAEAYMHLFPDGHNGSTRKQVLRAIEGHYDLIVTWNTLADGLKHLRDD